jgi:hypothetical protein
MLQPDAPFARTIYPCRNVVPLERIIGSCLNTVFECGFVLALNIVKCIARMNEAGN